MTMKRDMRGELLLAEFLTTPWALMPEHLHALTAVFDRWSKHAPAGEDLLERVMADRQARQIKRQSAQSASGDGIAILPLYGVVTQRGNMVEDVSGPGTTSTQLLGAALRQALADDTVSQILIDIDSPGGSVYGVAELADQIQSARSTKPVVAVANSLAASAAYWIGCAAGELYVTPGGEVGSIGVWQAHFDYSQALAADGVTPTLISAGKYKVEGNPYGPLDEQALGFMQSRVDDYYGAFTKAVAKGRGQPIASVRDGMGQGRVLGADAALGQKMVDGIATFDDVIAMMQKRGRAQSRATSRLTQARNTLALM
ncbi:S49 family peptidase [Xanthomonas sp. GPE 39]|uniref:S49 family peptidase n=1 Tax=Xanthomonas sp. GPE 39 TaxID=1583099 RepID=UPI001910AD12|nr:S49 family peptidase [Xanthomonas sp. GPE 39]